MREAHEKPQTNRSSRQKSLWAKLRFWIRDPARAPDPEKQASDESAVPANPPLAPAQSRTLRRPTLETITTGAILSDLAHAPASTVRDEYSVTKLSFDIQRDLAQELGRRRSSVPTAALETVLAAQTRQDHEAAPSATAADGIANADLITAVDTLNPRATISGEPHSTVSTNEAPSLPEADGNPFATPRPPTPEEKVAVEAQPEEKKTIPAWQTIKKAYVSTYCPSEPPRLILPSPPTDVEKVLYIKSNRLGLYTFGVFSFLSLSAGMWLFVVSAVPFYWFGAVVVLLQLYLVISYTVSVVGKDFDMKDHNDALESFKITQETAPSVDIYLPCCKEPLDVLENTYKYVKALKYPEGRLKVYVLDDGALNSVKELAESFRFNYITRDDRPRLKKAGNLRWAFARTSGDFFAIYDADFCPRPDFLLETIPEHLADPKAAIIQTPQFFRSLPTQTWTEQGAGSIQELFYRIVEVNRNRWGASICVGSNAVYRREALVETGGTAEIGFSEDVHTGFYAVDRGWKVKYVPLCLACGICPDTPRAFFSQQMRWCMGSTTLLTNPDFWRSNLGWIQKICYLSGMMYYSAISLSIFINPMPGILLIWVRPDFVKYYNLAFAVPSIVYSLITLRLWTKSAYGLNVQYIMVIQSYAYLTAIKDRILGRALAWTPSGDTKAHKHNKYRNMRILAWCWSICIVGALSSGCAYQIIKGHVHWYNCVPTILLDSFNLFLAHRFLLCHGKL